MARRTFADGTPAGQAAVYGALGEVAAAVERVPEPVELGRIVAERARALVRADGAAVFVWDEAADALRLLYASALPRRGPQLGNPPGAGAAAEAVQRGEPVVVEDDPARSDPDARGTARPVRAMLAVPLRVAGRQVGGLSVYCRQPHTWRPEELHAVSLLAAAIAPAIEAARLAGTVRSSLQRAGAIGELTQALAAAEDEAHVLDLVVGQAAALLQAPYARVWLDDGSGGFRCAAATGHVHARTRQRRLAADSVSGLAARGSSVLNLVDATAHPGWRVTRDFGDRTGLRAYLGAAISRAGVSLGVLEVMRPAHKPFDAAEEHLLSNLAAAAAVAVGDARQTARLRLQSQLLELAPAAIVVRDVRGGRVDFWNRGAAELYGRADTEVLGHPAHRLLRTRANAPLAQIEAEVVRVGRWEGELDQTRRDGSRIVVASRWALQRNQQGQPAAILEINTDLTVPRVAEEERRRMQLSVKAARADAQATQNRLELLIEAGALLAASPEYEVALRNVAQLAVGRVADLCTVVLVTEGRKPRSTITACASPAQEGVLRQLSSYWLGSSLPPWLTRALTAGHSTLYAEIPDTRLMADARTDIELQLFRALGPRSVIHVPLVARGRTLGLLTLVSTTSARRYGTADLALAEQLARQCALAIDAGRSYQERYDALGVPERFLERPAHEPRTPPARLESRPAVRLDRLVDQALDPASAAQALARMNAATAGLDMLARHPAHLSSARLVRRSPIGRHRLDLANLVRTTAQRVQDQLELGRNLYVDTPAEAVLVRADRRRLQQVLVSLLDNATQDSPRGGTVRVSVQADDSGVVVRIEDQGIRRAPSGAGRIVDMFERVPVPEHPWGMDVAWLNCRVILERLGGKIWAEHAGEGRATAVQVWLPLARALAPQRGVHNPRQSPGPT